MSYDLDAYNIMRAFTSFGSDIDLTAQSGCPQGPPEQLDIYNNDTADQNIVLQGPDGENNTIICPPAFTRIIYKTKTNKIIASGTGTIAQVVAYWHNIGNPKLNA